MTATEGTLLALAAWTFALVLWQLVLLRQLVTMLRAMLERVDGILRSFLQQLQE